MIFRRSKSIDSVWANICKHEGAVFYTVRKIPYTYSVKEDYILINNDSRRRITKSAIEKALKLENPRPSKIQKENIWGPSYIYGIISDSRIL